MVVLASCVFTKSGTRAGKTLVSRQYVDMPTTRIQGLLAAFPKLVSTASSQHTFVETEFVRYVYQPLDKLYVLLITSKHSNILQDLETLQLLAKLVPDVCGAATSDAVQAKVFDLLFAFDEVLTHGGYKDTTTLRQVRTNMEMDSHDERLAHLIRLSQMNEAREVASHKAKSLAEARKAAAKDPMAGMGMSGMGSSGFGSTTSGGGGMGMNDYDDHSAYATPAPAPAPKPAMETRRTAGMGLRKSQGKSASLMKNLAAEDRFAAATGAGAGAGAGTGTGAAAAAAAAAAPADSAVTADMAARFTEKLNIQMLRDGTLRKMEARGALTLVCQDEGATRACINLQRGDVAGFQFQPHPNINKAAFNNNAVVVLKDPARSLPVGKDVGVLKWRRVVSDDGEVPIIFNCWPEEVDVGVMTVNIEYTLQRKDLTLMDVAVRIPLPSASTPTIVSCDGSHQHNASERVMEWNIVCVDSSNGSGTLEFQIDGEDDTAFFPLSISFTAKQCLVPLEVASVSALDDSYEPSHPVTFQQSHTMRVMEYSISDE